MQFDAIFDSALFMRSENEGATGCLYMKKDNGLALEEHERFIGWQRETVVRSAGDRPVRVHRLVTGDAQGSTGGDQKPKPAAKQPTLPERARVVLADLTLGGQQSATYDQWVAELAKYSQGATVKDRRDVAVRAIRAVLNAGHARIEDNNTARLL
jgi:hypothetical protein